MLSLKRAFYYLIHNKIQFLDSCVKNLYFLFPDKLYLTLRYRLAMGAWINWKHPRNFNEKLQWLKLYNRKPEYTTMVDKLAVKDYVAKKIGEQYVIQTLGVWDKSEDVDWDKLPNRFVLKTTHGGGSCGVVVCKDKRAFDKNEAINKLNQSFKQDIYSNYREWPYKNVVRRILAERYMESNMKTVDTDLADYKFYCFNGEPTYCQVIRDRHTKETIDFYDMEWNHMPFVGLNPIANNGLNPVAKPVHLENMKKICKELSRGIPFIRVDLYVIDDKEYFGEITFFPASGIGIFTPEEWNYKLGTCINLQMKYD